MFQELRRLDTITHAQINLSTQSFNNTNSEQVLVDLRKFKDCVSDIQLYDHRERASTDIISERTDDIETPMSQLLLESFWHKDIDFTDKLWTFIQQSDHLEYIRFILDDVLTDIVNGSLQPAISPNNETKLAKYIRKLYITSEETKVDAEEKITDLIGSEQSIINLVREIGYEKLRKDYFNFFIKRELTSLSNLEKICKPWSVDILALWKLHYCLEVVITPTIYLNLTPDCQCTLLKAAIDYYSVNQVDIMSPKFCLLLLPFHESWSSLRDLCNSRQPVIWQHGSIHQNITGFNEAIVTRVENMIACDRTEDVDRIKGRNRLLREEVLILPNMKSKKK